MTNRPVYLALPGLSVTTLLLNLPCITSFSDSPKPIVVIDSHDYDRLRADALKDGGESQMAQYLLMAYDELRRRDLVRLVNYARFYPKQVQKQYLRQNKTLLSNAPDWVNRRAAVKRAEGWIRYGRGSYQDQFRSSLGEDPESFDVLRQVERKQRQKMKQGGGDPIGWNENILNKGVAALAVRRRADRVLNADVRAVITGSDYEIIGEFLTATQSRNNIQLTTDGTLGHESINGTAPHLEQLDPIHRIAGISPEMAADTRDTLDLAGEIATEITEVQYDDWFVLGPTLALPQYQDIFDFNLIRRQAQKETDIDQIVKESKYVIDELEAKTEVNSLGERLRYEAGWLAESQSISPTYNWMQNDLVDMVDYAVSLADYSREVRSLLEEDDVSQTAVFIGLSSLSEPTRRYNENSVYRTSLDLINRLNPTSIDEMELEKLRKKRRGDTWTEYNDWFEMTDRTR